MDDLTNATLLYGIGGAAVIGVLVQVVKQLLCISEARWTRILPLVAIILAFGWNELIAGVSDEVPSGWESILLVSILTGLSAIGMYSGQKAITGLGSVAPASPDATARTGPNT
jgi:ABC-type uncharacterized transport system permease subunit